MHDVLLKNHFEMDVFVLLMMRLHSMHTLFCSHSFNNFCFMCTFVRWFFLFFLIFHILQFNLVNETSDCCGTYDINNIASILSIHIVYRSLFLIEVVVVVALDAGTLSKMSPFGKLQFFVTRHKVIRKCEQKLKSTKAAGSAYSSITWIELQELNWMITPRQCIHCYKLLCD